MVIVSTVTGKGSVGCKNSSSNIKHSDSYIPGFPVKTSRSSHVNVKSKLNVIVPGWQLHFSVVGESDGTEDGIVDKESDGADDGTIDGNDDGTVDSGSGTKAGQRSGEGGSTVTYKQIRSLKSIIFVRISRYQDAVRKMILW